MRMMYGIAVLCFAVACGVPSEWERIHESTGLHSQPVYDIRFFDARHGISLTIGEILATDDGGLSWSTVLTGDKIGFASLFVNRNEVWVAGSRNGSSAVFYSSDEGRNWNELRFSDRSERVTRIFDLCVDDTRQIWVASETGVFGIEYLENDLEVTSFAKSESFVRSIDCDHALGVVAVDNGGFLSQGKGGAMKIKRRFDFVPLTVRLFEDEAWILGYLGETGILVRCTDDLENCVTVETKNGIRFYDVAMLNNRGWLVGSSGAIFWTENGGINWEPRSSPTERDLVSVGMLGPDKVWIGGDRMTILRHGFVGR